MSEDKERVLTLRVIVKDKDKASWIWKMGQRNEDLGIEVRAITEGDLFKRHDILEKAVDKFLDRDLSLVDWHDSSFKEVKDGDTNEYNDDSAMFEDAWEALDKHWG